MQNCCLLALRVSLLLGIDDAARRLSESRSPAQRAARLAREAAAEALRRKNRSPPVRIAGSLPPVGESYHVATLPELELAQPVYAEVMTFT